MQSVEFQQAKSTVWRALAYFNIYRFLLGFLFISLDWVGRLPGPLDAYSSRLFSFFSVLYFLLAISFSFFIHIQKPSYLFQVVSHVIADILILTILMFASAGLNNGFGVLLVIAVAGGGTLLSHRISFFFAAVATLCVFAHEVYAQLNWDSYETNYTQAGFLGIAFFVTALISYTLANRLQQSEELAKRQALDLEKVSSLNEHIVQRLQSGIMVLDKALNIRLANEAAMQSLDIKGDIINKNLLLLSSDLAAFIRHWQAGKGGRTVTFKTEHGALEIQASFSQIALAAETELLVFIEDVSTIKQRAQQMKLASLGRLAAGIAHEVRNPLGAISHAAQLLSESNDFSPEDSRLTDIIMQHSNRVNKIIENVMNISRRDQLALETINLVEWLQHFADEFRQGQQLAAREVKIDAKKPDISVQLDPQQLHQIVWNLCENGIRYSQEAPLLQIYCGIRADTKRPYLDIMDTGPGVAKENQDRLFEPFFTTSHTGTGLGLYIARELSEANQASLSLLDADDIDGSGCCFRLTFSHPDKQHALV